VSSVGWQTLEEHIRGEAQKMRDLPTQGRQAMAFSAERLAVLNADYTVVTGKRVKRFVCPVTLKDGPGGGPCDGHILNDSIKEASGKSVVPGLLAAAGTTSGKTVVVFSAVGDSVTAVSKVFVTLSFYLTSLVLSAYVQAWAQCRVSQRGLISGVGRTAESRRSCRITTGCDT
jgi:hypothetical protein